MRVLHIAQNYSPVGGIETYLLDLLPLLEDRGVENIMVHRKNDLSPEESNGRVAFHIPPDEGKGTAPGRVADVIARERPSLIFVHDEYEPKVASVVATLAPTVGYMHIFYPVCPGLGKVFRNGDEVCSRAFGPRCVTNMYVKRCASARHPLSVIRAMRVTQGHLAAYRQFARVIVASNYMRDLVVQNGIPESAVAVVPYFVPESREPEASLANGDADHPQILFAGRLEYEKGLPYLLQALANIHRRYRLRVCGDGSLRAEYENLTKDLGLADRVEFRGWLTKDQLDEAYQAAAIVVMPTVMPEPFGKVGVEAMANGRPVIAFDVGGIPEWLVHNETGFLVPPRDVSGLVRRLEQLLVDSELAHKIGVKGRNRAKEKYSADQHMDQLMRIFEEVTQ
ncbi:MAG: glycosyltransferase family 4 protein [Anaerolineales bacterium]